MEARLAKATDIVARTKYLLPEHFIGYVLEKENRFMGMGWCAWDTKDRPFVFFEIADEARQYRYRISRWSRRFLNVLEDACDELYTLEDEDEPGATKWIEWLGFRATDETVNGHRVMKL